jgi:hypothetical protein
LKSLRENVKANQFTPQEVDSLTGYDV